MTFITNDTFRQVTAAKVATLPTIAINGSATVNLFSVVGEGLSLVHLYGYLSSAITGVNSAPTFGFGYNPTVNGSADDISNLTSAPWTTTTPLGSMLAMPGGVADPTLARTGASRAVLSEAPRHRVLRQSGTVRLNILNGSGSNGSLTGGQITFYAVYEPHAPGAYMVPV
jgi:hypothetical protein